MALTKEKAKKILRHKQVRGKALTPDQIAFFHAIAGGAKPKKKKERS